MWNNNFCVLQPLVDIIIKIKVSIHQLSKILCFPQNCIEEVTASSQL